jgi:hypothetical protein
MTQNLIQAYRQAPWRGQIQWIGTILLGVVIVGLMMWLRLSITAQTVAAGYEIRNLEATKTATMQNSAYLRSKIAEMGTTETLLERAAEMDFQPITPDDILYVKVKGYSGRQTPILTFGNSPSDQSTTLLQSAYTESLWEWLNKKMVTMKSSPGSILLP